MMMMITILSFFGHVNVSDMHEYLASLSLECSECCVRVLSNGKMRHYFLSNLEPFK